MCPARAPVAIAPAGAPAVASDGAPRVRHAPGTGRMLARALGLRCPHCGGRGLLASCFTFQERCPGCGLRIERGERDYFVGAYLFNLIAVELILFVCVVGFVFVTWPAVPWELLTWVAGVLMLVGCIFCYPFAKTTWLAVDLAIRPLTAEELRWHRDGGDVGDRELPHV